MNCRLRAWRRQAGIRESALMGAVLNGQDVLSWISRHANPLTAVEPDASLGDLRPLRPMVRDAAVVGLGESTHGAHEQFTLKHRVVRFLVERMGFRTVALEEDWTKGLHIDAYLRTGTGDPRTLLADAGTPWRTAEIAELIRWMRSHNAAHPADPLRFIGVDVIKVRRSAYDAVADHITRVAPDLLDELDRHYDVIKPPADIDAYVRWLVREPDRQPFLDHARQADDLVRTLPVADGHDLALHHSRAIVGFYEYYLRGEVAVRDRYMAENVIWWREHVGGRSVFWAANVHTADGRPLEISYPPFPPAVHHTAGAFLRDHLGSGYRAIGGTFHRGSVNAGFAPP
ncbi:MAG TPA: erythromycin esterase family protein, partial [Micromonosporaceae bacterium]|nr:erythromycin esterase family protein [Micromonosporaceae bacterium]